MTVYDLIKQWATEQGYQVTNPRFGLSDFVVCKSIRFYLSSNNPLVVCSDCQVYLGDGEKDKLSYPDYFERLKLYIEKHKNCIYTPLQRYGRYGRAQGTKP